MGEKIIVGPINRGQRSDREPFVIDNDSFPTLINAYQWRGRIKRKRGTKQIGRLTRIIYDHSLINSAVSPWTFNLFTDAVPPITIETNGQIAPGTVQISINPAPLSGAITGYTNASDCEVFAVANTLKNGDFVTIAGVTVVPNTGPAIINGGPWGPVEALTNSFKIGVDSHSWGKWQAGGTWTKVLGPGTTFYDLGDGTLQTTKTAPFDPNNFGTINYVTGDITLTFTAGAGLPVVSTFGYYPNLPVMGLEDLILESDNFPGTLAFDTKYSYNISTISPFDIHNVNFFKNPDTGSYSGYTQKSADTEFTWNGQDYQQFWTTNYQGALWATNGINVPFNISNIGMQYKAISAPGVAIITAGNGTTIPAVADITITAHGLVQGDFIFINEVNGIPGINYQTGYVTSANPQAANLVRVTFPTAILVGAWTSGGIAQYLTNTSDSTRDCLKWYDGDPFTGNNGWVNFCPPLSNLDYSIANKPLGKYYLVGARMIVPFKDRLLFVGPVIQTSSPGSQLYLQDTVIYSQNGTPYYTCSYNGDPLLATTIFTPVLVPDNQTATATAWFEDSTGFGGFISAGYDMPINSVSSNNDALIMGFDSLQARFVFTGNDVVPFNFFVINSEYGTSSVFSAINMDDGVLSRGSRGFILTNQSQCVRFDLENPDQVFQIVLTNNGQERFCAQRDFINEWVYFTYNGNSDNTETSKFPNTTFFYNYRDQSWATFNETYTTYGQWKQQTGDSWLTMDVASWNEWTDPWNSGESSLLQPDIIAGNQQGFVMLRDQDTQEDPSLYIKNITGSLIESPDHTLNDGDYITIIGALGTVSSQVNNKIFKVNVVDANSFYIQPSIAGGTYTGAATYKRMYIPFIQSKQFQTAWSMQRKTRIGVQQYLLSSTTNAQITLLIYLSQDNSNAWNDGPIVPDPESMNDGLIYSTVLYTCPESTNLGLTPANTNLQMPTASSQNQIWHRVNTSLLGDTVQVGFTLSPQQMTDVTVDTGTPISQFAEIEIHGFIIDASPSMMLS